VIPTGGRPPASDPSISARMSRQRRSRTRPEDAVGAALRALGVAYRRNRRSLPGSPDFSSIRQGFAVFVNGCFWHHHTGCRRASVPTRNAEFWRGKFRANRKRDAAKIRSLRAMGFKVVVVWECRTNRIDEMIGRLGHILRRSKMGVSGGVEIGESFDQVGVVEHVPWDRGGRIEVD
jgi:DNA mismatch endonuclease (patch repair protein)